MANLGKLGTQKDLANETKRKASSREHRLSGAGWQQGEQLP